jgi:hypothetical protein
MSLYRKALLILLFIAITIAVYSVALNDGYKVGVRRGCADQLINGLDRNTIECKYKK